MAESQHRQVAKDALYGYGEALRFLADRRGDLSRPGDLFLVEATAGAPLEWLVIEEVCPGSFKVVPADLNPSAGSADVDLSETGWAGPVTLRCAFSTTLPGMALRSDLRTGVVSPGALEAARRKTGAVRSGELRGKPWEQEVDAEIEYQDWCSEVLQPAIEALELAWPAVMEENSPFLRGEAGKDRVPGRFHAWQMAAAIVATAGLTFFLGDLGSKRPPGGLVESPVPLLNPQLLWFQPTTDTLRGDGSEILVSPGAEWLTVVLETFNARPFPAYGVELERSPGAEVVWTTSQLQRQGASEVIFALPAEMLPPGAYILRLSGHQEGETSLLEEFPFTVKHAE